MTRVSLLTYNLWNVQRWPERKAALQSFFQRFRPDIFCLQELRPETRAALDEALPDYRRVDDPLPGWSRESNLYWNGTMLEEVAHGLEDIAFSTDPHRGLFWARLRVAPGDRTILVATAHYTYQEHPDEIASGLSPRLAQTRQTISALQRLASEGEAVFFLGDLNDPVLPTYLLAQAGYHSVFSQLNLVPPPTWPAFPTANTVNWSHLSNQAIDWIVANNAAKPLMAAVPQFYDGDLSPSDHWPVWALYEIPAAN